MEWQEPNSQQAGLFERAGVTGARRHLFLCIGPECCESAEGEALWECVKRRVKESGAQVMRTKAACLRVCSGGPWLVVYPEGAWYGGVTPQRFEQILERHVLGGEPVQEWLAMCNPLVTPCGKDRSEGPVSSASIDPKKDGGLPVQ